MDEKLRKYVLDAKVVKEMFDGTVLAEIITKGRWKYGRSNDNGTMSKVITNERLCRKEIKKDYERRWERLNEARTAEWRQ